MTYCNAWDFLSQNFLLGFQFALGLYTCVWVFGQWKFLLQWVTELSK